MLRTLSSGAGAVTALGAAPTVSLLVIMRPVISALIAEYFGGPVDGLATSITSSAAGSNYTLAYAFVLGAILLGLAFYCVTLALEKLATRHAPLPPERPAVGR